MCLMENVLSASTELTTHVESGGGYTRCSPPQLNMLALHLEFFPIFSEKFLSSRGTQDLSDLACLSYNILLMFQTEKTVKGLFLLKC